MSHTLEFESVDRELHRNAREIARAFPKWKFEADMTSDGLPSLLAWLPWQNRQSDDFTIAFVRTSSGWMAVTPNGARIGDLRPSLPMLVNDHLGRLGESHLHTTATAIGR